MHRITRRFLLAFVLAVLLATVAALGVVLAGSGASEAILEWCAVVAAGLPLFMVILSWVSGGDCHSQWSPRPRLGHTDRDAEFARLLEERER